MCITPRLMLFLNSADEELNGKKKNCTYDPVYYEKLALIRSSLSIIGLQIVNL